ncbi:class I SAM-dependent methyltransferase [Actinomadura graeca]|uniref:Class I SAM-dependent methyltransferase n=1 Tax=Actinomadura graeca TaxID=2750812 RepID=A0ABX8QUL6_9ACTN|nr:class I SAM-dependent methyltransferase [Actinomadura graeca]QXJ22499.1 class I SAM-dependent methyltransferase [Actinomadura graeca]
MEAVPERLAWAVRTLAIEPADEVLEIGCGGGVAVALVCPGLGTGRITAIDRSATQTARAERRNAEDIAAGRAVVRTAALETAAFDGERFDKIFAVNVNLFWVRDPAAELRVIGGILKPGGALYLFYEPPSADRAGQVAADLDRVLRRKGFMTEVSTARTSRRAALLCVKASLGATPR